MQVSRLIVSLAGAFGMLILPGCSDSSKSSPTAAAPEIRGEPITPQAATAPVVASVAQESEPTPVEASSSASLPGLATQSETDTRVPQASPSPVSPPSTPPVDGPVTLAEAPVSPTSREGAGTSATPLPAGGSEVEATPAAASPAPVASVDSASSGATEPGDAGAGKGAAGDEFVTVGFDRLAAFNLELTEELLTGTTNETVSASVPSKTADEQIPEAVKAYDQKRIALKGFMLPLRVEAGHVTELLMMRDQSMCCFGAVPKINEWVSVKMVGQGVKPIMDQAVTLFGTLHVGEMRENGYLVGIYRMDGERMSGPLDY